MLIHSPLNEIARVFNSDIEYTGCFTEPLVTLADNSKAKSLLGWQPKQNVIEWIKKNYE
jgi:nucleoside-diphosphate-sugar epimerase